MFWNIDRPFRGSWHGPAADVSASDALIEEAFGELIPSLLEARIDLFECDLASIASTAGIETFVRAMGTRIGMPSSADLYLKRFEEHGPAARPIFFLLSETSLVFGSCLAQQRAMCLNVFSSNFYPPYLTATVCQKWFAARDVTVSIGFRGPHRAAFGYLLEAEA